jgi:hypothetical protein
MAEARVEEYGSGYLIRPLDEPAADWLRAFGQAGAIWVGAAVSPDQRSGKAPLSPALERHGRGPPKRTSAPAPARLDPEGLP